VRDQTLTRQTTSFVSPVFSGYIPQSETDSEIKEIEAPGGSLCIFRRIPSTALCVESALARYYPLAQALNMERRRLQDWKREARQRTLETQLAVRRGRSAVLNANVEMPNSITNANALQEPPLQNQHSNKTRSSLFSSNPQSPRRKHTETHLSETCINKTFFNLLRMVSPDKRDPVKRIALTPHGVHVSKQVQHNHALLGDGV
jgi:hypothetical protein